MTAPSLQARVRDAFDQYHDDILSGTYAFGGRRLWRQHPYLANMLDAAGGAYDDNALLTINSLGLRARENPNPEALRIALLGGSVAFGSYAPSNGTTISALLEKRLRQSLGAQRPVEVYNLGVGGHVMAQHAIMLHHIALEHYQPHAVICLAGYNDAHSLYKGHAPGEPLQNEFGAMLRAMQTGSHQAFIKLVLIQALQARYRSFDAVIKRLQAVNRAWREAGQESPAPSAPIDPDHLADAERQRAQRGGAHMGRLSHRLRAMLAGLGIPYVAALQPMLGRGEKPPAPMEALILREYRASRAGFFPFMNGVFDAAWTELNAPTPAGVAQEKYAAVDCSVDFSAVARQLFVDPAHMGDAGNALVAQTLESALTPLL
ncbi:SGNH/GDSL hydrolase family protein [Magnetofaba australis]|uniref:Putative GDSL-like Lipase/Acylhydrolase n=1 Tax=Magnetofaba australis IT-1 TaxID=1434232 RepID=A0A1Y2JYV7_9PROT|nr:SGNH/GDSL hydrolase family protein [Magnetofaba australis]OSM00066.1 putative GDSL-like Lipase/Acylhydrolase [Magnetofaba australis IT-1]